MPRREANRDLPPERMADENHGSMNPIEEVLLNEIGIVHGVPIRRRNRGFTETRQIDQMHAMRMLEERRNSTKAFATAAPSVQEDQMTGCRLSTDFVDQARSAVLEALDVDESTSQGESP